MERYRSISPAFWNDSELAQLDANIVLFFIAIQNYSDDNGVFHARKHWIKETVFVKWKSVSIQKISKALKILTELKKIIPFSHNGSDYFYITDFKKCQRIDKRWAKYFIEPSIVETIIFEKMGLQENGNTDPEPIYNDSSFNFHVSGTREAYTDKFGRRHHDVNHAYISNSNSNSKK